MKRIILILIIAFLCSWNIQQSDFHEIFLNKKTVIIISPDSTEIENMKTRLGDDFYTIADDVMFYRSQLYEVMDSLKINYIRSDKRLLRIITETDSLELNMDASEIKWRYVFYDGKALVEADIYEIIDLTR